jgi:hypothetical protein
MKASTVMSVSSSHVCKHSRATGGNTGRTSATGSSLPPLLELALWKDGEKREEVLLEEHET